MARGEAGNSKLTELQVQEIKRLKGTLTGKEIGTLFGVHKDTVNKILSGKIWKHVP